MDTMMDTMARLRQKQGEAASAYADLAERIANGQQVDEGKVAAILSAAGKSVGDLEQAVGDCNHAAELRQQVVAQEVEVARLKMERDGLPDASKLFAESSRLEAEGNALAARHSAVNFAIFQGGQTLNKLRVELAGLESTTKGDSHEPKTR